MKKYISGFLAIIIAVTAFAFTKPTEKKFVDYYWFQTNASGTTVMQPARSDIASPTDPSGCTLGADYCSLAFDQSKTTLDASGHRVLKPGITASDRDAISKRN